MFDTSLMRSPLHSYGLAARAKAADVTCGVWANEVPLLAYISLRGNANQTEFLVAVKSTLGLDLPTKPCASTSNRPLSILWMSPDEWLITCERSQLESLQQSLKAVLTGIHSQVVDNSGGYTTLILQGANATDVLQHCTIYVLHNLSKDKVVGTTFGKMSLFLSRHDDGYKLVFRRSFADYIWTLLERSAVPYGFGVQSLK